MLFKIELRIEHDIVAGVLLHHVIKSILAARHWHEVANNRNTGVEDTLVNSTAQLIAEQSLPIDPEDLHDGSFTGDLKG